MKRLIFSIFAALCIASGIHAQEHLRERVFLSTDKSIYVAGDMVWLSAWCVDIGTGKLSDFSKVAYVELHSNDGLAATGKLALEKGRGAGRITLNNNVPTGNYRIFAYTAISCNEQGFDYLRDARTISIFNTLSTERVKDGVEICDTPASALVPSGNGSISIETSDTRVSTNGSITVRNNGNSPASFSLSIFHEDGIAAPATSTVGDFISGVRNASPAIGFSQDRIPEYEGEVINARVVGTDAKGISDLALKSAFISSPGTPDRAYTATLDENGRTTFFTSNIYGDQELFLEIESVADGNICHLELDSPFVNVPVSGIPSLQMSSDYSEALESRSMGMQLEKTFNADTLYSFLPLREHKLLDKKVRYVLDDYTRFPTMEEIMIEFIVEMRTRKDQDGRKDVQVRLGDPSKGDVYFPVNASLIMIDGVPILNHEQFLSYDPLLVQYVDIYCDTYVFGSRVFNGVANFITYKGNLPGMNFADNVRVADYEGVSYPMAYRCTQAGSDYPDHRQTILWEPLLTLAPGQSARIEYRTPAYSGKFSVAVEGMADDMTPITSRSSIEVR